MNRARVRLLVGIVVAILAATTAPSLGMPLCTLSNATPLTFDRIYDADHPHDGRASFVVTCARTQTAMISLLYSHRMTSGTRGSDLLYDLYATPDHSSIWGSGSDGVTVPQTFSAGQPTIIYIYARIPAHQQPAPGQFSDNIDIVTMP
jgi:spore coat protein U-like protein